MSVDEAVRSVRSAVALSHSEHVCVLRVTGSEAREALETVCPRELTIQDGQMLQSVFLDADGRVIADSYVCADEDGFLLLVEGLTAPDLVSYLNQYVPSSFDVRFEDITSQHRLFSLNGPYAWELLAEVVSPEIIGLPYLGFYHDQRFTCFRASKTGEYGYDLLVEREAAPQLWQRLTLGGAEFDLTHVGLEALDVCALENFVFNVRAEGRLERNPLELQLNWRISRRKSFVGAEALNVLRREGVQRRAVLISSTARLPEGSFVYCDDRPIGRVVTGHFSPTRADHLAIALLDRAFAAPGLASYRGGVSGDNAVSVVSAPAVNNRSLYVDPQRHAYKTRQGHTFPALVLAS